MCVGGSKLKRQYKTAADDREMARDILLTSSVRHHKVHDLPFDDLMFVAKQRYSEALVAWVTHRETCAECHALYGQDDQVQFASV